METTLLQETIVQKVLHTDDNQLLDYLNQLLISHDNQEAKGLLTIEKSIVSASNDDYLYVNSIPNEIAFYLDNNWMSE